MCCSTLEPATTALLSDCLTWGLVAADKVSDQPSEFRSCLLQSTMPAFLIPSAVDISCSFSSAAIHVLCNCCHTLMAKMQEENCDRNLTVQHALLDSIVDELGAVLETDLHSAVGPKLGLQRFRRVSHVVVNLASAQSMCGADTKFEITSRIAAVVGRKLAGAVVVGSRNAEVVAALVDLVKVGGVKWESTNIFWSFCRKSICTFGQTETGRHFSPILTNLPCIFFLLFFQNVCASALRVKPLDSGLAILTQPKGSWPMLTCHWCWFTS